MKSLIALSCVFGVVSLASLAVWATSSAREVPAPPPPVRLGVHLLEAEKRLGTVGLNETVQTTFTVVNDTDGSIALGEPMKSCTCAAADLEKRELAPGERCTLAITIKTGTRRVPRAETVGLLYKANGSDERQLIARMLFEPKGAFDVEPAELLLTRANPTATFAVRRNAAAEGHVVLKVWSNHRCVKVDATQLPTVTLELDLTTPDESILNAECIVYTNHPAEGTIVVPVRVRK